MLKERFGPVKARRDGECSQCNRGYRKGQWINFDNDEQPPTIWCDSCKEKASDGSETDSRDCQPLQNFSQGDSLILAALERLVAKVAKTTTRNGIEELIDEHLRETFNLIEKDMLAVERQNSELRKRVEALEKQLGVGSNGLRLLSNDDRQ